MLQGSATAPIRQQASRLSTHSSRLPTRVMTTSPRPTPRAAKAPESPADIAISSPKCQTRRSPSRSSRQQRGLRARGKRLEQVRDQVHGRIVCRSMGTRTRRTSRGPSAGSTSRPPTSRPPRPSTASCSAGSRGPAGPARQLLDGAGRRRAGRRDLRRRAGERARDPAALVQLRQRRGRADDQARGRGARAASCSMRAVRRQRRGPDRRSSATRPGRTSCVWQPGEHIGAGAGQRARLR